MAIRLIGNLVRRLLLLAGFLVSLVVVAILGWAFSSRSLPDLSDWHRLELASEFAAEDIERMRTLEDYLEREQRLFDELEIYVNERVPAPDRLNFNRYYRGSVVYPGGMAQDYNRTFEIEPSGTERCGVLLVHGLTDAPYSVRHLARVFADAGCYALGLRMPGHGTIPAALTRAGFEDWQAAVALGARVVRERIADAPLFLVGYSNGGALVVNEALDGVLDPSRRVDGLFLFSPMIGVTPFSRFATWGEILAGLDYFEKFEWLDVQPEFDPFKYNSFPKAAGHETFVVTATLRRRLAALARSGELTRMPPVLTFQSLVDATVSTPAIVRDLYGRMSAPGSELVLFDLNRASDIGPFLNQDHAAFCEDLLTGPPLPYSLTLVTNTSGDTRDVAERHREAGASSVSERPIGAQWPDGTYSLSHVAIVFPPEDELYGAGPASDAAGLPRLGALNPRGERGVTSVPVSQLIRLRHNPFFPYLRERLDAALAQRLGDG